MLNAPVSRTSAPAEEAGFERGGTKYPEWDVHRRRYRRDFFPIDASCSCYACTGFTRAYVHHLYQANEILGTILGAIHNVHFYQSFMAEMRKAICEKNFLYWKRAFLADYSGKAKVSAPRPTSR